MEKEQNNTVELQKADELAKLGDKAFSSYTWKLRKSCNDSTPNPYSDDDWANDLSYPEHDLELAFDYYQQALAKYEMILGPDHIKVGEMHFNCGRVAMDPMYDDVIALDFFKRALPIFLEKKPYSRDLAVLYENLGSVCFDMNDLLSSLDYYHKSLSLFNMMILCGDEIDLTDLKEKISKTDSKLGLHIVHEGDKCGFADKENNIVIPCIWSDVQEFSEGLCGVKDDNQLCGFINYRGEVVIPCIYEDAFSFKNGMACVADKVFNKYIDRDGEYIATESESKPEHIEAIYKASVLAKYGKHAEAAECILPAVSSYDSNPMKLLLSYYALAEQYDKLIEKCNKIIKYDERSELVVLAKLLLAIAYEEGKGVEQDLIQAFRYFNAVRLENNISDNDYQQLDEFLKRHPEMLELPEVQSALAIFDEDDDF